MRIALKISYEIRRTDRAYKKSSMSTSRNFYRCLNQWSRYGMQISDACSFSFKANFFIQYFGSDLLVIIGIILTLCVKLPSRFFPQETINFIGLKVKNLSAPYRHLSPLSQGTISLKGPATKSRAACPQPSELIRSIVHWREIQGESWKREHGSFLSIIHMVCLRWRRLHVS